MKCTMETKTTFTLTTSFLPLAKQTDAHERLIALFGEDNVIVRRRFTQKKIEFSVLFDDQVTITVDGMKRIMESILEGN